jgi:hypothetical protein
VRQSLEFSYSMPSLVDVVQKVRDCSFSVMLHSLFLRLFSCNLDFCIASMRKGGGGAEM